MWQKMIKKIIFNYYLYMSEKSSTFVAILGFYVIERIIIKNTIQNEFIRIDQQDLR